MFCTDHDHGTDLLTAVRCPGKLTGRAESLLWLIVALLLVVGLGWAWETGQAKQCSWHQQYDTNTATTVRYCGPGK